MIIYPKNLFVLRFDFLLLACFFLSLALPLLTGCERADAARGAGQNAPPAAAIAVAPFSIAGFVYEPSAPLKAEIKPLFDTKNPPAVRNYSLRFAGAKGETVFGLFVLPKTASAKRPAPAVLLQHGLGGNKTQLVLLATTLASKGFASVMIDTAGHGERRAFANRASVGDWDLADIRLACAQTTMDLRRALDYLETRADVDKKRIGYVGVSLGGIIGSLFVPNEPRVRAAVFWAAGGGWGNIARKSEISLAKRRRAAESATSQDFTRVGEEMRDVDPLTYIARAAPRPILFLNGTNDTLVPTATGKALFAAARDVKKQILLPGGHIPDIPTMVTETVGWLQRYVAK